MKRNFLLALFAVFTLALNAQEQYDPRTNKNIVFKTVSPKLKVRDKVIVLNRSPYYILQAVVCQVINHELVPIGSATNLSPNESWEIASFRGGKLKDLRGQTLAIKAKGAKLSVGDENRTNVWTPYGNVGVRHKDIDKEELNNIKPEDITYEFDAALSEDKHDLYIELFTSSGVNAMDF